MRKGISILHVVIFLVILLLVGLGYVFSIAFRDVTTFEKGIRDTVVIEGINVMELLRKNLEQSLAYSYYQASFEIAKNGGYSTTTTAIWRNYNDISGFPDFEKNLKSRTLDTLNLYRKAIVDTGITTVDYTKIDAVKKDDGEYLSAISKDKENNDQEIKVSKSSFYEVSNNANVFVLIPTKTLELLRIGRENFVTPNDKIREKIIEGISACGFKSSYNQNSQTSAGSMRKCGSFPSAEEVFANQNGFGFSAGKDRIVQNVNLKLNSLESELSSSTISTKLLNREIRSGITPACTQATEECCTLAGEECAAFWQRTGCTFSYFSSAKADVKITDESAKYPVYDSIVDMRNIQLDFNVISGNDYSRRLI